ncbi:MAG: YceI family protein [Bdellovibrio sp.]
MKKICFFLLLLLPVFANAECLQISEKDLLVKWTAFKTPAKVGVGGQFSTFKFDGKNKGTSIKDITYGLGLKIDHQSVSTGNEARDAKIAKFFFSTTKNKEIFARVTKIDDKNITLKVNMNGVDRDVPMSYTILGNELKAQGVIDVFDFSMNKQLAAINKACMALHEGKTWSDVNLELTAQFKACD